MDRAEPICEWPSSEKGKARPPRIEKGRTPPNGTGRGAWVDPFIVFDALEFLLGSDEVAKAAGVTRPEEHTPDAAALQARKGRQHSECQAGVRVHVQSPNLWHRTRRTPAPGQSTGSTRVLPVRRWTATPLPHTHRCTRRCRYPSATPHPCFSLVNPRLEARSHTSLVHTDHPTLGTVGGTQGERFKEAPRQGQGFRAPPPSKRGPQKNPT